MALSVNTNIGAMAALQSLTATNKDLATTQSRINSGFNVASTKDDSASYTIAQTLRGDLGSLKAVGTSRSNRLRDSSSTSSMSRPRSTFEIGRLYDARSRPCRIRSRHHGTRWPSRLITVSRIGSSTRS